MYPAILASVVLACISASAAAPAHSNVSSVSLAVAMERSVCPIEEYIDDVPGRIPRRIKFLRCKQEPNPMCLEKEVSHACCVKRHHSYKMQCKNLTDQVLVRFNQTGDQLHKYRVFVGCSCQLDPVLPIKEQQ